MPLVTVIVTAYNEEAFVEEAVRSVLAQTFTDFELLAIDDGSTDGTADILESIRDPRLRVIHQINRGISETRNRGIEEARGDIIAFLDGDDIWLPSRLARDVAIFAAEPDVGVTFWNFRRFSEEGEYSLEGFDIYTELAAVRTRQASGVDAAVLDRHCFELFVSMAEIPGYFSSISVRRSQIGDLRFLKRRTPIYGRGGFLEDWHLFLLLVRGTAVAWGREVMVQRRVHKHNWSRDYRNFEYAKLASLEALQPADLTQSERKALIDRIARQHASVGYWHANKGQYATAYVWFVKTIKRGRPLSGMKGIAMTLRTAAGMLNQRRPS